MQVRYVVARVFFDIANDKVREDVVSDLHFAQGAVIDGRAGVIVPSHYLDKVEEYLSQMNPENFSSKPRYPNRVATFGNVPHIGLRHGLTGPVLFGAEEPGVESFDEHYGSVPTIVPKTEPYEPGFRHLTEG